MSKDKFDLSNVGGQPKDWMQREHEKALDSIASKKRYFARVRYPTGSQESFLGFFYQQEHAEWRARSRFDLEGWEVDSVRPETDFEAAMYKGARIAIRSARIAVGAAIALGTYLFLWEGVVSIGDKTIASLTLNAVVGALFKVSFMLGLFWVSWEIAFGSGPRDP